MRKNKIEGPIPGAGRKEKYGEATTTVAFRVPKSKSEEIKKIVKNFLKSLHN